MVSAVWTACYADGLPNLPSHCREQALDRAVDDITWRCPVKACKKRFSIITWQSSCGIRDLKNILTSTFGLKLLNSALYELNGKNKSKKWLF